MFTPASQVFKSTIGEDVIDRRMTQDEFTNILAESIQKGLCYMERSMAPVEEDDVRITDNFINNNITHIYREGYSMVVRINDDYYNYDVDGILTLLKFAGYKTKVYGMYKDHTLWNIIKGIFTHPTIIIYA